MLVLLVQWSKAECGKMICLIDVGMFGALLISSGAELKPYRMPVDRVRRTSKSLRSFLNVQELARILKHEKVSFVVIEQQTPHRGQGFWSNASLMHSAGLIEGVAAGLGLSYRLVMPQQWRQSLKLGKGKDQAFIRMRRECPALADQVSSWPLDVRQAVGDCWAMLQWARAEGLATDDWLA